ncbi:DUF1638 domain-containing protein [Minwuia thermotolerans]|uniref:DUF1638 domain-containing protein n=1 Tax=Minwuia thermotolerans TaxID=2056226 RepID=A0A2M9G026_9PROT|nr:DUF1638 domain-containing protein [Minwuia thermotolerans]PJK29049.1 hypothetical protein CVT23_14115 [Minwuia thermotolerans]
MPDTASGRLRADLSDAAQERTLIIACGALAREIGGMIGRGGLGHLALKCLPATLHNTPDKIPGAVREAVLQARETYGDVLVGYADCGTGGRLDKVCEELGVERIPGPHCYAFYSGNAAFEALAEEEYTAFYLTDFLTRQFETLVIKPLGLDRHPELRDQYFGNYEKLVYLAQTDDPDLTAQARAAADRLGLAFERRETGLGDLQAFIDRNV